ncbi:MAG TPA: hypothetical protein VMX13_05595 [Sedimentisphaerales bacterium]|nr:hypothetical protein [Sedimentisphaerales bacterium]
MRALKICLWIAGVGCLTSVVGMFLPVRLAESLAKVFGGPAFPDSPLCLYALRVVSATYVGVGVFFVILALRPMKYGVLVPFSGLASVFLGVVCGITGLVVGMPVLWFLGDSLSCVVLGVLILFFWQKAQQTVKAE